VYPPPYRPSASAESGSASASASASNIDGQHLNLVIRVPVRVPEVDSAFELDVGSPSASIAPNLSGVQLKPHQLVLVQRCVDMEAGSVHLDRAFDVTIGRAMSGTYEDAVAAASNVTGGGTHPASFHSSSSLLRTRVGIIGDKAGSGKSFVVLSLIAIGRDVTAPADSMVRSFADDRVVLTTHGAPRTVVETTLLVVPHNLCGQWESYLSRWNGCGNERPIRYMTVSRNKHLLAIRQAGALDSVDLVVVTSTFYNAVAAVLTRSMKDASATEERWQKPGRLRRVVFDEADSLAISGVSTLDACFHWFVTASYKSMIFPFGDGSTIVSQQDESSAAVVEVQRTTGIRSSGFVKSLWSELGHTAMSRSVAHALVAKNSDAFVDASMHLPV
jgi:hypothetical protein